MNDPTDKHPLIAALDAEDKAIIDNKPFTRRESAAIQLRVPMSGDPDIDAMIRQSRRMDLVGQAMQGLSAGLDHDTFRLLHDGVRGGMRHARVATVLADALLFWHGLADDEKDDGKAKLIEALDRLTREVSACWYMSETRHAVGNTNHNAVEECLAAARKALASAKASVKP